MAKKTTSAAIDESGARVKEVNEPVSQSDITALVDPRQAFFKSIEGLMRNYNNDYKTNAQSVVVNDETVENITGIIRALETTIRDIKKRRLEITRPLDAAKNAALNAEKEAIGPMENDLAMLKPKVAKYIADKKRAAEEAARIEQEEKLAAMQEMKEDLDAEADGAKGETAQEMSQELQTEIAIETKKTVKPKEKQIVRTEVGSASTRKVWKGDISDEEAFIKWAVDNERWELINVNASAWNQYAKALKKPLEVPGAVIYCDEVLTTRKGSK